MPAQNRIPRNTRPRPGLRPLAWGLALLAGAQGLAAQVPVIEPGSAAGPTVFEDVNSSPQGSCEPNLAVPSVLHDNYGNPIGQVGCMASGISPIPPGFPDKLQAAAVSLIPVGPTLFRGKTFKSYDFEISASNSGRASAIPALITAQIDIQGLLAALLEGRAEVEVSIDVLDITGGAGQAELVVSQKIYENRIGGSFEAGVSAGLGGS